VKRYIAFIDFDGTITSKDTLLELIRFQKGSFLFYAGFLINAPWLLAYKLGIISNHRAKQRVLRFFFRKTPAEEFQKKCQAFSSIILPRYIRRKALDEIKRLKQLEAEIVVVSASAANWIQPWTDSMGLKLIATVLETRNGKMTGKIDGRNCSGKEKPRRIKSAYDLNSFDELYAYGDSKGDLPMMALATHSFFRPFR
jgi:HAD superfamily hydrolase (TIGR01490 family)